MRELCAFLLQWQSTQRRRSNLEAPALRRERASPRARRFVAARLPPAAARPFPSPLDRSRRSLVRSLAIRGQDGFVDGVHRTDGEGLRPLEGLQRVGVCFRLVPSWSGRTVRGFVCSRGLERVVREVLLFVVLCTPCKR